MPFLMKRMQLLLYEKLNRERQHILSEFVQVKGLMPLLMKRRNKQQWTASDKRELIQDLKCLSHVSAYIAVLVMPGGFALMPVMACWLDRRSGRRIGPQVQ